jgi:UV DNA damage endonuclease
MHIGYACQTIGIHSTNFKTCILKNADEANLDKIITYNLDSLDKILDYNISNNIKLFRITSDLIPFGSSPANTLKWWENYKDQFEALGKKAVDNNMRLSMHPGQYTLLNSPNEDVVARSILDLEYHNRILDTMKLNKSNKLILHIGGVYGDKDEAIKRFINTWKCLDRELKDRIILENDDKLYTISDVLYIAEQVDTPVVFDNLHNKINQSIEPLDEIEWINRCKKTWKQEDGTQKIHYSDQNSLKKLGSHSDTIDGEAFQSFCHRLGREDIDIMLEVKDKNQSTIKCMNFVTTNSSITLLENEWSRYKYAVLEKSPTDYNQIRNLLKDKNSYPVEAFYRHINHAMEQEVESGKAINAAQHVWGYFTEWADDKEKVTFEKRCVSYLEGKLSLNALKKYLWKLSMKYNQEYLLHSFYFAEVMTKPASSEDL